MNTKDLNLSQLNVHKLLTCGNPDAAMLYLYIQCGNPAFQADSELPLTGSRYSAAVAALRQLGLWLEDVPVLQPARQAPSYTEDDVLRAMNSTRDFPMLVDEVQRSLGRILSTEELKVVLSFRNYLGLPAEVICMLVCHCKDRARRRGSNRNPSLRTLEKEAFIWAEQGINTMEEAAAYMQADNAKRSRIAELMRLLNIYGRPLTAGEEKYAESWLSMGFDSDALRMAYEKTCLNTGGLKWPYMNKILLSWHQQGLHTGAQVQSGDRKPGRPGVAAQVERVREGTAALGSFEKDAIARMLQEGTKEE